MLPSLIDFFGRGGAAGIDPSTVYSRAQLPGPRSQTCEWLVRSDGGAATGRSMICPKTGSHFFGIVL